MGESTTIVAFDQHAATTVAAVLLPGHRTPALHPMTSALPELPVRPTAGPPGHGALLLRGRAVRV